MSTTLTKVSPRPETNDDNSSSKLNISIKHDNHTEGEGNTPTEKRVFPLNTMDSSKSFASTSKSKHTRGDNESTRSKTSKSVRNKSDVFEIDDHIDRLADKLQKDYRSRSKTSNEWNAKKPALTRFLMCSCLRAPRMFSATEICSYARIGDLLLFREGVTFESEYLSPEVLRGVKSSLDGKYIPKTRYIKLWNKIGIVVSLKSEQDDEFIKYILHADDIGLKLRKLSEVTNSCVISRDLCSLRPVCIKNKKNQQLYSEFVDDLESIALLARDGKLLWSNFEKVDAHKNDDKATLEEDIALVLDNPKLTRFSGLYTQRMRRLSYSPSLEGVQEATRLFYSIMAVHQHNGNNTVLHSSQKLSMADRSEEDFIPLELIYKSLTVMNDDEGQSQQGDQEFAIRLRNMLKNMDENNDGRVSLVRVYFCYGFTCSLTLCRCCYVLG